MALRDFGRSMPVYVTNKTADGFIASYSLALWMSLLALMLIWVNIAVWGCIGLYEAVRVIF